MMKFWCKCCHVDQQTTAWLPVLNFVESISVYTWNYILYAVTLHNGKGYERQYVYMCN